MEEETMQKGFSSRWGVIATLIGLAIGTGNIWRFPRQAAANGGGAFIIAWTVMLLIVAIPLAIAEMAIGRATRRGCPGAFKDMLGKKYTWMGCFMALTVAGIASYYTVTMAWVLRYLILALTGDLFGGDKEVLWHTVSEGSPLTVACFLICLFITWYITRGGISGSIEHFMEKCIPMLFFLLAVVAGRAMLLGKAAPEAAGVAAGLDFLFRVEPEYLFSGVTWIQALMQILWSVGVGWGLVLTYGAFTQCKSDVALNGFIQGFGNNMASLLAGVAVIPTLFAFYPKERALEICASGNTGLTFISLANIFDSMVGGRVIAVLFFLCLVLAALSSNLGHFLVTSLPFEDYGWSRKKANVFMMLVVGIWGFPSSLNTKIHGNQDFVSTYALMIGILFTCFLVWKVGAEKFRKNFINIPENDLDVGPWWDICVKFIAPMVVLILIGWMLSPMGYGYIGAENMWRFFEVESFCTLVVQLGIYFLISQFLARKVNTSKKQKSYYNGMTFPEIPEEYE